VAEEGGGRNPITGILQRRYFGIPVYVYGGVGVLVLAWYLKRRAAAKAAEKTANTSSSTVSDVTSQVLPSAYPMSWSSDVFVNQTFPETPAATTTPTTTTQTTPTVAPAQKYVHVQPGQSLVDTITTLQQGGWNGILDQLVAANPGLYNNITWGPKSNPALVYDIAARRQDRFTKEATYVLP
jgi:hypothetical protein